MNNSRPATRAVDISAIVPVYNVASFIEECLQSICSQSFTGSYEVILIDDCSTDRSLEYCRDFAASYPEIFRLIENESNLGVSATRNIGLDAMEKPRYFTFVDPDDILPAGAFADLFDAAEKNRAAIVKGNNSVFSASYEKPSRFNVKTESLIQGPAVLTTLFEHEKVRGHVWGKLFRSDLADCRFPPQVSMVEDLYYSCEVFARAETLFLLNKETYRYRIHKLGATGRKYESDSYIEWLDTVEKTRLFASDAQQVRAHKNLLLRTITQMARECRDLPLTMMRNILPVIESRRQKWNLRLGSVINDGLGIRSLTRYFKLMLAIRDIKRVFADRKH